MKLIPTTSERCQLLLNKWRNHLSLSNYEQSQLKGELKYLDKQIEQLITKTLRIAVFGRVGVGKSSLLNALLGQERFLTDVAHGSTRKTTKATWEQSIPNLNKIELIDTPGIDEIDASARGRLASRIAMQSDLIILVLDSDITVVEIEALNHLLKKNKPVLITLNRCDQWLPSQQKEIISSIRKRLPLEASKIQILPVAAAPRKVNLLANGRIRSQPIHPKIKNLRKSLITLLNNEGELLLSLNALRQADNFHHSLKRCRLQRSKVAAQGMIGKFAAIKASGVAANPLFLIDLAGGFACDTALVLQLSKLYGLQIGGDGARRLLSQLSIYNAFLGGAHLGIMLTLGVLRSLLIFAAPITGGLTLASSAPIAIAQAALAVYTTKSIGRLAAKEFLKGSQRREPQPGAMMKRLIQRDPQVKKWLINWADNHTNKAQHYGVLLP